MCVCVCGGGGGGAYCKNRDHIINVEVIGDASSEDLGVLGGGGGGEGTCFPGKSLKFEVIELPEMH